MLDRIKNIVKEAKIIPRVRLGRQLFSVSGLNFQEFSLIRKVRRHSQVSLKCLANVYELAKKIESKKIKGSFVECGVCKGGSSLVMAFAASKARSHRKIWLFDSFQGNPEPIEIDGALAKQCAKGKTQGRLLPIGMNLASLNEVNELFFKKFSLSKDEIIIKKGWFQDTLPVYNSQIGEIAILRLDADWYESTKCCLENLYDHVIEGGYIIFDDYNYFPGCKIAVDEFIDKRNLKVNLIEIDYTAVYFKRA